MNMRLPRDFTSYPQFRMIQNGLGGDAIKAMVAWLCLWSELAYQVDIHQSPGVFYTQYMENFIATVPLEEKDILLGLFMNPSKLLTLGENDHYFCELFYNTNPDLDPAYFNPRELGAPLKALLLSVEKAQQDMRPFMAQLPPECWLRPNGERITPEAMNRILWLVRTIDKITDMPERVLKRWTPGVINDALVAVEHFSDAKLVAVCKCIHDRRNQKHLSPNPDTILKRFIDVSFKVMPEDGWQNWKERINNPRAYGKNAT